MNTTQRTIGELEVLSLDVPYVAEPTELYYTVCGDRPHNLLLESAEVDSKQDLKSLMLIDAAVRIVCRGTEVQLEALTDNGLNVLQTIEHNIPDTVGRQRTSNSLTLTFPTAERALDEDSRLRQASSFDALRMVQHAFDTSGHPQEALFLGGLFAYDLVAGFEPLAEVEQDNKCPDYLFYIAETLLVIDHQRRKGKLQATLFGGDQYTNSYFELSRRLQQIKEACLAPATVPPAIQLTQCEPEVSVSDADFCQTVADLKQYVIGGDVFQVVPSRQFTLPCPSPLVAYKELKIGNPSLTCFSCKMPISPSLVLHQKVR